MTSVPVVDLLSADAAARGLLDADPRLAGLLAHDPRDADAIVAAARIAAERELDRDALAAAVAEGLRELAAPDPALRAAERLRTPGTVVVVAGQQPGLLGGSLMVPVKALAAAAVARRLEDAGVPAVPVFWSASEDHDHAEADHVGWLREGRVERLSVPLPGDGRMLSRVPVPDGAAGVVADVLHSLATGPGHTVLAETLPPRAGESFGTWTGRLLARVLGAHGIVVVEPHRLRALAEPVVRFDAERPGALRAAVERARGRVVAAGFASPLELRRDALWFDVDEAGRRSPPQAPPGDPEGVSWNVVSRVLAQDLALPVAAQVCGPAEAAYVALLREAHDMLGIPQPAVLLRPGATIVEPAARRACEALGVAPVDVVRSGAAAIPVPDHGADAQVDALRRAIAALPEGRSAASRRRRAALEREADLFASALVREAAEADAVRARRVRTVTTELRPGGDLQERVLSFLPWYAAGGDAVVARLLELLGTGEPLHHVLRTEEL